MYTCISKRNNKNIECNKCIFVFICPEKEPNGDLALNHHPRYWKTKEDRAMQVMVPKVSMISVISMQVIVPKISILRWIWRIIWG